MIPIFNIIVLRLSFVKTLMDFLLFRGEKPILIFP